jgi:hypothetical protein
LSFSKDTEVLFACSLLLQQKEWLTWASDNITAQKSLHDEAHKSNNYSTTDGHFSFGFKPMPPTKDTNNRTVLATGIDYPLRIFIHF